MNMISLKNVWYKYSNSREWVLKNISISFRTKEITVLLGPNGSGKTTLMKIGSLIYKPVKGSVYIDDKDYWSLDDHEKLIIRRTIVYVHEKPVILRGSVVDNIIYGLRLRGFDKREAVEKAFEVLKELEIEELAYRDASQLSAGQSQLISLARALILKPQIMFLDEPFSHLDKNKRTKLINILRRVKEEDRGVVISIHEESLVEKISPDNLIEIENGEIINIKTSQKI
ncbi:MAG: ATP-binding cassette domain-containing protein [Desulfurococcales archaeon]|nr:ATP-binding cassette domain-containing protein [Desulfurococcales archaeon]